MTDLLPQLDSYLAKVTPASHPELRRMEALAKRSDFPIVGPLVGRALFQYAKLSGAKRIFELGSGYGYSAFWFSLACGKNCEIHLTDFEESNLEKAREHFKKAKLKSKFVYHSGDAISAFKKTRGKFDIIFNDIDKHSYPKVPALAVDRLNNGGLLITDNLIKDGKVFGPERDTATQGVRKYTRIVYKHPQLFTTIIPLRDGVAVSIKL